MKYVIEKSKCTGCTACLHACPKNAISVCENDEGFRYPVIDQEKCINCGLCKKKCPVLNTKLNESINKCYVGYSKEDVYKNNSSSGGIFPLIADYILSEKGIVVGAAFDEKFYLKHIAITNKNDLNKLKGSKYLQSDLNNIFLYIKKNVKSKKILFVGTPCQVAGLKAFLKNDCDNLFCIDLVCHGVPSPKLFSKYVDELEKKYNDELLNYNFRDKCTGWDNYSNTMQFKKHKRSELQKNNKYMKLFLSNVSLRESCYDCNFKLGNKYSDITLGDFWGVSNYYPNMYNKNGVSAIIINTKKGQIIFDSVIDKIKYCECELNEILTENSSLKVSSKKPKEREDFFNNISNFSIDDLEKKYVAKKKFYKRILNKFKNIIIKKLKIK